MKVRTSTSAFTLIEMLTVMVVIAVLASLVVSVNAFAQRKAATTRAEAEIKTMAAACESYKGDFGNYPRDFEADSYTDALCPVLHGNPMDKEKVYAKACLSLYKAISGDARLGIDPEPPAEKTDKPDGKPETKGYCEFRPNQLRKNLSGEIEFIQDPFGNSYGYSTKCAADEEVYRQKILKKPDFPRPKSFGFSPTFDLWSTGGVIVKDGSPTDADRKQWIKNW